jgi:hypothetical protein
MITDAQLAAAKRKALGYLPREPQNAITVLVSELQAHDPHFRPERTIEGLRLATAGDDAGLRKFIKEFAL